VYDAILKSFQSFASSSFVCTVFNSITLKPNRRTNAQKFSFYPVRQYCIILLLTKPIEMRTSLFEFNFGKWKWNLARFVCSILTDYIYNLHVVRGHECMIKEMRRVIWVQHLFWCLFVLLSLQQISLWLLLLRTKRKISLLRTELKCRGEWQIKSRLSSSCLIFRFFLLWCIVPN
jgi:hypothetical protein